jgi:hypothetical protein
MNWINKHLEKIAFVSIVFGALWVLFGPLILTQKSFSIVDFAGGENNTGIIGDTIGGITSPIVGLISVVLLYLALIKQIESNRISVNEANFRIIYQEITQLKGDFEKYTFENKYGIDAILKFSSTMGVKDINGQLVEDDYSLLDKFELLLAKYHKVFYLLDNLKTSPEYKDILSKDLQNTYVLYFSSCYNITQGNWAVTVADSNHLIKGKMYMIKDHLRIIQENILQRNIVR